MTCCTYLSRGKQSSGCVRFSFALLVIILYCHSSEARPLSARWSNPCELSTPILFTVSLFLDISKENAQDLCNNIIRSTRVAHAQAQEVLTFYEKLLEALSNLNRPLESIMEVEDSFKDVSFVEGTASHRLNWLPKVNQEEAAKKNFIEVVRYFFSTLQYFGVGLEQMNTDQVLYEGKYFDQFRAVEDNMAQLLCTLQLAMSSLGAMPNEDVTRDVMSQQYRNVGSHSQRLIRNYLILRDYVRALRIMLNTFETQKDKYIDSFDAERTLSKTTQHLTFTKEPKRLDTH